MNTRRTEFLGGMRAELPLMLGVAPFGLIFGALAAQLGVPTSIAQAMSSIIFGGSSQFIAAPLIVTATPPLVLVLTVFVVNLRHALYSASVAPYLERLSPLWKGLLAYLLTDEAYVVAIAHFHAPGSRAAHVDVPDERHWFLLGAGVTLWVFWQMSTAVGVLVGTQVPKEWSLDFALPLTFIALVMPMLRSRAYVAAAVSAGAVGLLTFGLPYKLGLVLAAVFGIVVGMVVEAWTNRQRRHTAGGGGRGVRT